MKPFGASRFLLIDFQLFGLTPGSFCTARRKDAQVPLLMKFLHLVKVEDFLWFLRVFFESFRRFSVFLNNRRDEFQVFLLFFQILGVFDLKSCTFFLIQF
jgi:hypothetical protein